MTNWDSIPRHPLAFGPSCEKCGAMNIYHGDIATYDLDGRECRLDEALHDGDAFVTWAGGTYGTVKWNHLTLKERR